MLTWRADRRLLAMHFRSLSIGPKSLDREDRTVDAVLSTEAPVPMYDWSRLEVVPEILLADGAQIPRQVPLLDNHLRQSVRFQLGSVRSLQRSGREVHGRLHFSSVSTQQFALVTEGHLTDVSTGYRVLQRTYIPAGSTKTVAGQTFTGPVNVVTRWKLYELSLTSIRTLPDVNRRRRTGQDPGTGNGESGSGPAGDGRVHRPGRGVDGSHTYGKRCHSGFCRNVVHPARPAEDHPRRNPAGICGTRGTGSVKLELGWRPPATIEVPCRI